MLYDASDTITSIHSRVSHTHSTAISVELFEDKPIAQSPLNKISVRVNTTLLAGAPPLVMCECLFSIEALHIHRIWLLTIHLYHASRHSHLLDISRARQRFPRTLEPAIVLASTRLGKQAILLDDWTFPSRLAGI